MEEKLYKYWLYYKDNELYAYTDNKEYAEKFEEFRNMDLFTRVKKRITKDDVNYLAMEFQGSYLMSNTYKGYNTKNKKYYNIEIITTEIESLNVGNKKVYMENAGLYHNCVIDPYYFNNKLMVALKNIGYFSVYAVYKGIDEYPFELNIPKIDEISLFVYFYGNTIDERKLI